MRRRHRPDRSSAFDLLEKLALLGAIGLIAAPALKGIAYRWRMRNPVAAKEPAVDGALDDTFPASDPPAVRFVDIPENRKNGA